MPGIREAVILSLEIALLATVVATALGTMIALALVRHRFRGRGPTNMLVFLPMATPEIVLGASLLTLFLQMRFATGFTTIFIAHVMFIISYVVVTVKARLVGFDRHLEEAAMDLGANEWTTFRKVTLPLIAPAILSAALLGFAISIDDFVITYFNAGPETTFPLFVWGSARVAVPPQVNVVASAIFVVALAPDARRTSSGRPADERNRMTTPDRRVRPRLKRWPATTSGCTSPAWASTRDSAPPIIVRGEGCYLEDDEGRATSTRSPGCSRCRSATRSARRSARRRRRSCASCPSTRTGRTRTRARSSSPLRSPRSRPAT